MATREERLQLLEKVGKKLVVVSDEKLSEYEANCENHMNNVTRFVMYLIYNCIVLNIHRTSLSCSDYHFTAAKRQKVESINNTFVTEVKKTRSTQELQTPMKRSIFL